MDNSVNLSELPTFPKLPFPHLQIRKEKVVVRIRETMYIVLSLVVEI